jgi:hypothetical protein
MSRIRTIKPVFWTHEILSALPEPTHMLAAQLINYADDEGYFNANPGLVKAECCPLREPSVSIQSSLNSLAKIGYVRFGAGPDGRKYGQIISFEQHQVINRPTPSKIRDLDIKWDESLTPHAQLSEGSSPEGNGREGNRKGNREASTANAVPADKGKLIGTLPLNDGTDWKVYAADADELQPLYPAVDVRQELRSMKGWLIGNPTLRKTKRGIGRFITAWLDKEQDKAGGVYAKPSNKSDRTLDALRASLAADDQGRTGAAGDFAQGRVIEGGVGPLRGGAGELGDGRPPGRPEVVVAAT